MARAVLWLPAARWVKAEWVPLLDVVLSIEDYIGDLRPLQGEQLFQRWEAAVADLQRHLLAGEVRSSAHLYPEQGKPAVVALTAAFWRRFRIRSFSTSSSLRRGDKVGKTADGGEIWSTIEGEETQSVLMDDTRAGKEVRSPEDWRIFLLAADLGLHYPLGPTAEAAPAEAETVAPNERKASRLQKVLLKEIIEVCGPGYDRLRPTEIRHRVGKSCGPKGAALESLDTFSRALGRRKD